MKTMIVYYSLEGNTEYAAKKIAAEIGADTLRIKPVKEYPDTGVRKFLWGGKSAVMTETPGLEAYKFDKDVYDRIEVVFVYCLSGARSGKAVGLLKSMGYDQVENIGGINAYNGIIEK